MLLVYVWLGVISFFIFILLFMMIRVMHSIRLLLSCMKDEVTSMKKQSNDDLELMLNKLEHHEQYFKRIVELEENTNHIHFLLKEMQSKPKTRKTTKTSVSKEKDAD